MKTNRKSTRAFKSSVTLRQAQGDKSTLITLSTPVEELPISDELKKLLKKKGYKLLKDVLKKKISDLRKKEGLSFENEIELFRIVEANGLEKWWGEE